MTATRDATASGHSFRVLAMLAVVAELAFAGVAGLSRWFPYEGAVTARPILPVLALLGVAFAVYLVALYVAVRAPTPLRGVWWVVIPALLFRATMVPSLPIQEVDIYRYLWDGAVTARGVSPYRYSPQQVKAADARASGRNAALPLDIKRLLAACDRAPALATILARVHFPKLPTIYPPVSQAVFAATECITPENASVYQRMVLMKGVLVLFDLATLAALIALLQWTGLHWGWSVAYGWCPLVLKEIAGSGHLDAIAVFLTTAALALGCRALFTCAGMTAARRRPVGRDSATPDKPWPPAVPARHGSRPLLVTAMVILALGVGAKLYPVVLAPLVLVTCARRLGWRTALVSATVFTLLVVLLLLPMLPAAPAARVGAEVGNDGGLPLPSVDTFLAPQDPSRGLAAFLRHWEMNDLAFMILFENLKPAPGIPRPQRAWFAVLPEWWRNTLLRPVAEWLGGDLRAAAFLVARLVTTGVLLIIMLVLLVQAASNSSPVVWLRAAFLTLAWFWLLAPTQNPWYWIWAVPLLPYARSRAWLVLSGLVLLYYLRFYLDYHWPDQAVPGFRYSGAWLFDFVVPWVEFGPWFVWLLLDWIWHRAVRQRIFSR